MRKLLSILLVVAMLLTSVLVAVPVTASTAADGTNTTLEEQGYTGITALNQITTAGGKYYLKNDITVTGINSFKSGASATELTTLNGNGFTITLGKSAQEPATEAVFAWSKNVCFESLKLDGWIITDASYAPAGNENGYYIAPLSSGFDGVVKLTDVTSDVDIVINNTVGYVGGVIAKNQNHGASEFNNVKFTGSITVSATGKVNNDLGGIMGRFGSSTAGEPETAFSMKNCVNEGTIVVDGKANPSGTVTTDGSVANIGGLLGKYEGTNTGAITASFENCANKGNITVYGGATTVAGFVGTALRKNATLTVSMSKCVNDGNINFHGSTSYVRAAGFLGEVEGNINISNSTNNGNVTFAKGLHEPYTAGMVARLWNGSADISGCVNNGAITVGNTPSSGTPHIGAAGILGTIGNADVSADVYANINNCINRGNINLFDSSYSTQAGGILGRAYRTPTVTITNCVNEGSVKGNSMGGWSFVGGILGAMVTLGCSNQPNILGGTYTVSNCHNYGELAGMNVGGIFGGTAQSGAKDSGTLNITVEYCTNNTGDKAITSATGFAGGIVGQIGDTSTSDSYATNSYNTVAIKYCGNYSKVVGKKAIGGIIAFRGGTATVGTTVIENCFNAGEVAHVSGDNGLPSGMVRTSLTPLTLTNCVNTGKVGGLNTHPLAPAASDNYINDSVTASGNTYTAKEASNTASGAHGTQVDATAAGASIAAIEKAIYEYVNADKPSAMIFSEAQWQARPTRSDGKFVGDVYIFRDFAVTKNAGQHYDGTIFGQEHTLTFSGFSSLVGYGENVSFRDLVLKGTITATEAGKHVGPLSMDGIAGHMDVINVISDVDIILNATAGNVGGVLGKTGTSAKFENVTWTGSITSNASQNKQMGGFAGICNNVELVDCISNGTVTFNANPSIWSCYFGAFLGETRNASFTGCVNRTDITSPGAIFIGGFAGVVFDGQLNFENCENQGDLTIQSLTNGSATVGGFVAYCDTSVSIKNSINSGNITVSALASGVTGAQGVGGFIAQCISASRTTKIENCINTGNISAANSYVGGIVGGGKGTNFSVVDCVNTGNVRTTAASGVVSAGGIVGQYVNDTSLTTYATIDSCVNAGKVSMTKNSATERGCDSYGHVGGILGSAAGKMDITNCIHMGSLGTGASETAIAGTFPITNLLETTYKPSDKKHNDTEFLNSLVIDSKATAGVPSNLYLEGTANQTWCKPYPDYNLVEGVENVYKRSRVATKTQIADKLEAIGTVGFSTTALEVAIDNFDSYTEGDYTVKSWTPYETAVTDAQTALDTYNDADTFERFQYTLAKAEIAIITAENALVTKADYYKDINAAITAAQGKTETDYTAATWTALQTALTNAQNAVSEGNEDDANIAALTLALTNATDGLVGVGALKEAIANVPAGDNSDGKYTTAAWNAMQTKLTAANNALANATDDSTVETATNELNAAVAALVDTTALRAKIAAAQEYTNVDGGEWTAASWTNLQNALTAANTALAEATTADAVTTAINNLDTAMNGLVPASTLVRLEAAVEDADKLLEADYTAASWSVFAAALATAKNAITNSADDEDTLIAAETELANATSGLINVKALKEAIAATATTEDSEFYTTDTWNAYTTACANANTALTATEQATVDAAATALTEAYEALEYSLATEEDLSEAADLIAWANEQNPDYYTTETWDAFAQVVETLVAIDGDSTHLAARNAIAAVITAKNELVKAGATEGDYAALEDVIAEAEALDEEAYVADTWKALAAALDEAKAIGDDALVETVDKARIAIEEAMSLLVEVPDVPTVEEIIAARVAALSERDRLEFEMALKREPAKNPENILAILDAIESDNA